MSIATLQTSREEARAEVGKILLAQADLAFFAEYMSTDGDGEAWYHAYEMHHLIAHELQQVLLFLQTDGAEGTQFLLILTPPQHGKSALVSRFFPAFALGNLPNLRVLEVSYGADLASENSRYVRNMILSDQYKAVFGNLSPNAEPVVLAADSKSAASWDLASPHRGGMIASGVGGAVPGRAKGLGIFDDPIKGHKEAQSQDIRDDAWDFYVSALRVRMRAGVLVMTHWHPDDPAGRIIKDMVTKPKGDKWKIVMLPGLIEEGMFAANREDQQKRMLDGVYLPLRDPLGRAVGEVLCPAMMPRNEMLKVRETQQEFYFQALYQQMPFSKDGQKYKKDWFRTVSKIPEGVTIKFILRYWDKANSSAGDFTVGVLMAYCSDGFFYILDVVRGQWTSYERDQKMRKAAEKDAAQYGKVFIWHQQDPGSAGKDSAEATNRLLMGFPAKFETVTGSKEDRSDPLESAFQGGLVFLLQAAWNDAFISECVAFNRGKYDDQVDAASSAYNKLLTMIRRPHKEVKSYQGS
ncbi:MAG: phage terminase large subunit [Chloroflexi bacterium]|nr:phage terminase large subunit [Chloroflexota bacterium]